MRFGISGTCRNQNRYNPIFQLDILKICIILSGVATLFAIGQLAVAGAMIHRYRKRPYLNVNHWISRNATIFSFLLQSIIILCSIVVLGYYLAYFIDLEAKICPVSYYNYTQLMVIWIIAAVLFIFSWVTWVIVAKFATQNTR